MRFWTVTKIKDKKGVENSVADHLSRMPITSTQDPPINDFLRDDMLLKVTASHSLVCEYHELHGFGVYTPRGKLKEVSAREQTPPMGCTISVPSLCRWVTQTLCTYGRRTKDHREMPCIIWRSLWCISHLSENLAERFLLAIYVRRYKELHPQMSKLPEAWRDHSSRFNTPELQSSS